MRAHAVPRLERFLAGLGHGGQAAHVWRAKAHAIAEGPPEQSLDALLDALGDLWRQVASTYLVARVPGPEELRAQRAGTVLLVVRCGFNPCASDFMPPNGGAWEGFTVQLTAIGPRDDPSTDHSEGHDFAAAVDGVARDIRKLVLAKKPVLVMAGSRGGVFLAGKGGLWDRMQLPEADPKRVPKVASLMLNVNPSVQAARLPEGVSLVLTYGSREGRYPLVYDDGSRVIGGGGKHPPGFSVFIRDRGAPSFAEPPPTSLEGLVNAGGGGGMSSRLQRFVYYKGDNSSQPSKADLSKWKALKQGPEEVAEWPQPPGFPEWPPEDITADKIWPHLKKPNEPPPFLGASYPRNRLSKLGTPQEQQASGPFGDGHNPASVYQDHCLLRLIDAALSPQPEPSFVASYRMLLTAERRQAEEALGLVPEALACAKELNAFGDVPRQGVPPLVAVAKGSPEWLSVEAAFYARHRSEYHADELARPWSPRDVRLTAVERVQNLAQLHAFRARKDAVLAGLAEAGVELPAAGCMRWGFHGATHAAIESIISDPVAGFKAVMTERALWGPGIYFARDALYSYYATGAIKPPGFCERGSDGTIKILLCLLVTGLPCAADQEMKLLPFFRKPMRYHSTVDSLSNPQICVLTEGVAVYPAYVISFKSAD